LILGGCGLIGNDFFGDIVEKVLSTPDELQLDQLENIKWHLVDRQNLDLQRKFKNTYSKLLDEIRKSLPTSKAPKYIWGAGHNGSSDAVNYSSAMSKFDQVGIRDFNQPYDWAPCASCMHPALHKKYEIKNDVIWFEHKKQIIKDFGSDSIPRFVNSGSNIDQTIELLGSANIILTNSYHGAYWGALLGKKVIVVGSWSSKFYLMRHQPVLISADDNWKAAVDKSKLYPDALDECVAATEKFWNKIKEQI
jgi:exopolysaccharide biosynthesis predicted pyruvyltransferase EpsI